MSLRQAVLGIVVLLAGPVSVYSGTKAGARVVPLENEIRQDLRVGTSLVSAAACTVSSVSSIAYTITGWATGIELYKSYMVPASGCENPYPFTVREINMPMYFAKGTTMLVSVDVEDIDASTPSCTKPGVLMGLSSEYQLTIPAAGGYNIWIPLDTPVVVNGPFFAGFFLGSALDTSLHARLYTDATPTHCQSWNIWDTTEGYVDLTNNSYYNFPGRLVMEINGTPGGAPEPAPEISILGPITGTTSMGTMALWAAEKSGSKIIDYVSFQYANGSNPFTEIGRVYDGSSPIRDGVTTASPGTGYSLNWDFSALREGTYTIQAIVMDTQNRVDTATMTAYLEPTPPLPTFKVPVNGENLCPPQAITMQCTDENMQHIQVYRHDAVTTYSAGLVTLAQSTLGDTNGNVSDGNHVATGEYGDYYSGPAAAAMLARLWYDRGYQKIMKSGSTLLSLSNVAESLATAFGTRTKRGTRDEDLYAGLAAYASARGGEFNFGYKHDPTYWDIRIGTEDEQRGVLLGLSGAPAFWVAVDGFSGWRQTDSTFLVSMSNPLTGTIVTAPCRFNSGTCDLQISGIWHHIDIMISMVPKAWTVTRQLVGTDTTKTGGWSVNMAATGLTENNLYFIRAAGRDSSGFSGEVASVTQYTCTGNYMPGDYDNNGANNINDLYVLINYILGKGNPPRGGATRADANCDNVVNITDVIYYMNYLFGTAVTPCR